MPYTRAQFRDVIRQRLGWATADTFVTDAELNNYINDSLAELHSLLTTCYAPGQWGWTETTLNIVANTATYALPADFGRLLSVKLLYANRYYPLHAGNNMTDVTTTLVNSWMPDSVRYYLDFILYGTAASTSPSNITFDPPPGSAQTVKVRYIQTPIQFTADGNVSWYGYDEYVVLDCCLKCLVKEESDSSAARASKEAYAQRIRMQCEPIDVGNAVTVQDARATETYRQDAAIEQVWFRR